MYKKDGEESQDPGGSIEYPQQVCQSGGHRWKLTVKRFQIMSKYPCKMN